MEQRRHCHEGQMQKNNFIMEEKMTRKPFCFEIWIQFAVTLLIGLTFATLSI
jgi:hypothetical protein